MLYHKMRLPHQAAQDFDAMVKLAPNNAAGWRMLGLYRMTAGDCHDAISAFQRCVQVDPTCKEAWTYMGQVRAKGLETWPTSFGSVFRTSIMSMYDLCEKQSGG